jgi:hypothetical protein
LSSVPRLDWLFVEEEADEEDGLGQTEQSVLIITGGMEGHTGGTITVFGTKGPGIDSGGGDILSIFSFDPEIFFEILPETFEIVVKNSKPPPPLFGSLEEEDGYWLLIRSVFGNMEPEGFAGEEEEEDSSLFVLVFSYTKGVFGNHVL